MARPSPPDATAPDARALDVTTTAARAYERDRYLTALLAPPAVRADLIALAAFAGEIARIPAFVSEPMLGEIRLQWWRDAIDRPYEAGGGGSAATGNPIADALAAAVRRHALDRARLHAMIDAQVARLVDAPFPDEQALAQNLLACDGSQFALASHVLGAAIAVDDPLIQDASLAYGLARILIELPATLAERRTLLPHDRSAAHGLAHDDVSGDAAERLRRLEPAMRELATSASTAAARIRAGLRRASPGLTAALLPVALVRPYLRASQVGGLQRSQLRDIAPFTRVWRLWLAHVTGRI